MSIGNNIRKFRKRAGFTQTAVVRELGMSMATLRHWEAEETSPTGTWIRKLAGFFHVPVEAIISEDLPTPKKQNHSVGTGMLVFERNGTRFELPANEKGYELMERFVENTISLPLK